MRVRVRQRVRVLAWQRVPEQRVLRAVPEQRVRQEPQVQPLRADQLPGRWPEQRGPRIAALRTAQSGK